MEKRGGKRPGAGRKPKAVELRQFETLTGLLDQAWPGEKRMAVIKKMVSLAEGGDVKATALLLAYGYGKPTERVELTGKDAKPIRIETIEVVRPDTG